MHYSHTNLINKHSSLPNVLVMFYSFCGCCYGLQDDDVRNALFLEQVAHAFLHTKPPMVRKYAFHMVLASHRYYRAMQVSSVAVGCVCM